jgi:hypothetical protein
MRRELATTLPIPRTGRRRRDFSIFFDEEVAEEASRRGRSQRAV